MTITSDSIPHVMMGDTIAATENSEPELSAQRKNPIRTNISQDDDDGTFSHLDDRLHHRHSTCPIDERGLTYKE